MNHRRYRHVPRQTRDASDMLFGELDELVAEYEHLNDEIAAGLDGLIPRSGLQYIGRDTST